MDETIDTLCLSTEEMYHALEAFNQKVSEDHQSNIEEPVIFSMDVVAMFPSLDIAEVARAVNEEFVNSDLEIEFDERELGLYLAIIFQKERRKELELKHLDEVVPRRKHEAAKSVLMSTEEITARSERTVSKCHPACKDPTREEVKRMMGVALEEAVKMPWGIMCTYLTERWEDRVKEVRSVTNWLESWQRCTRADGRSSWSVTWLKPHKISMTSSYTYSNTTTQQICNASTCQVEQQCPTRH